MHDESLDDTEIEALRQVGSAATELGAPLVTIGASTRQLIVPFGGVAQPDGTLVWSPEGREMSTLGLRRAYETGEDLEIEGVRLRMARLHWLVALKLFAFRDRGRRTLHDLQDADVMLRYATEALQERVFEELADDLATDRLDFDTAGAHLIGRDLAALRRGLAGRI